MSLVIAIKDKERVVLGSDKQVSTSYNKSHTTTKIWSIEKLPGVIMGGVGLSRGNQIIQYADFIDLNDVPEEIDTSYIIRNVAPAIIGTLQANGVNCEIPESGSCMMMPNTYIFAYKDRAWVIFPDQSVEEVADYIAIGSGSDVATGVLYATPDKHPFDRIVTAIDAAAETTLFVDNGVDIACTVLKNTDKKKLSDRTSEAEKVSISEEDKKAAKKNKKEKGGEEE